MGVWHWLLWVSGSSNVSDKWYGFWSGFGSDIGEVVLIGGLITIVRHHNCHVSGCWHLGRHQIAGGRYKVCTSCHRKATGRDVGEATTIEHVKAAHDADQRNP